MSATTFGVTLESSALAFSTEGIVPDKWIQETAGAVWAGIKSGVSTAINLAKNMFNGGKELFGAIARGDWKLFGDWFRDDPKSAIAGGLAVGVVGWFIGSATGITAVVSGGIASMWATLGSVKIGGFAVGAMLPTLQQAILGTTNTVMNLDWAQSDNAILAELNSSYLTFLNQFGESLGRTLVVMAFGGAKTNPRLTLNITAAAALSITKEIQDDDDISDELVEAMSELANVFIRYARNLAAKLGYLELRKFARNNVRTGIPAIDNKIKNWGLQERESFVISQKIDDKIEKITEENPPLGNLLEGLKEGASDAFNDCITMI
ncbi:hypothetical protein [Microcoleus sp. CAWBG640]|uniref:hypothetical protein n=1 Tax=Microcoleus sp. CAWBG640 TaxID=2841653 RepID=UPI00312B77A7